MSSTVVGVVGAGAMGSGIAQVFARAGHPVLLGDANPDAVAKARSAIVRSLARDVEKGRMDQADAEDVVSRIGDAGDLSAGYDAYASCGVVVEAVLESLDVKRKLIRGLERVVSADCVLATNTSSWSVAAIGGGSTIRIA